MLKPIGPVLADVAAKFAADALTFVADAGNVFELTEALASAQQQADAECDIGGAIVYCCLPDGRQIEKVTMMRRVLSDGSIVFDATLHFEK